MRHAETPGLTCISNVPSAGVDVLVTVCVMESTFVHFMIVLTAPVIDAGLNPAVMLTIDTSTVPLGGQGTD